MAVQYGSGPRPAARRAKRRFLNSLETSFARSSTASKASLKDRSRRAKTPWQCSTDRARGRQPVVPNVGFLNCLETGLTPSSTASKASLKDRSPQGQSTMAVQYGSGPRPAAHTAKRRFLNCLETSLSHVPALPVKLRSKTRSRRAKTPWQCSTDRARGRQPVVPNVAF